MTEFENGLYINGKTLPIENRKTFDIYNPATGGLVAKVPAASEHDINTAVDAAEQAQVSWAELPAYRRADAIRTFVTLMRKNADKLAHLDAICMGKPITAHKADVEESCKIANYFAGLVETAYGQTSTATPNHLNISLRQPFGVVAAIIPFNFPVLHWVMEIIPACGAGNAMILKTSEKSPLSGMLLASLATEAGFPPGIVQVVSGAGETGALLSSHMKIRKISFTGSPRTGRAVMQAAAKSNLKDVALELGGKSPIIVLNDADLDIAAKEAATSITLNSGQICIASSRIYVQAEVADKFKEQLVQHFSKLIVGDPSDKNTEVGPQVDAQQTATVLRYLEAGKTAGKVLVGGNISSEGPNYVQPTIFTDISDDNIINTQEIFGPVLVFHTFTDESEAVRRANDTDYGLYSSVFTSNVDRAIRISKLLQAGNIGVNCTSPYGSYDLPFGGFKGSGIGRTKGSQAVAAWLEEKSIYFRHKPIDA